MNILTVISVLLWTLHGLCIACLGVGLFTQDWFEDWNGDSYGIVPFHSDDAGSFKAMSIMMIVVFVFSVVLLISHGILLIVVWRAGHRGPYSKYIFLMMFLNGCPLLLVLPPLILFLDHLSPTVFVGSSAVIFLSSIAALIVLGPPFFVSIRFWIPV